MNKLKGCSARSSLLLKGGGTVKKYILSFGVTIGTIALLFFIGNTFHISLLSVQWLYVNEPENFQMEAKGGLIPVAVGLILGFITDYVLSEKEKKQRHPL